jgi:hypothetical protein
MYRVLFAMYRKEGTSITRRFAGLRHYEVLPVVDQIPVVASEGAVR